MISEDMPDLVLHNSRIRYVPIGSIPSVRSDLHLNVDRFVHRRILLIDAIGYIVV